MLNIVELVDEISQINAEWKAGDVYFTTMDFTYAYGQVSLNKKTSEQCNFSLVGGKSTGTYLFKKLILRSYVNVRKSYRQLN